MPKSQTPQSAYQQIFFRDYIETGPRLIARKSRKYISLYDLYRHGKEYLAGVELGKQHYVIDLPGPWHALAAAIFLQYRALKDSGQHVIFKGQSSSAYKLVASIFRPGAQVESLERAKRLLAWYLASNAGPLGAIHPPTFYGVAQHYGIWTDLLDFTPDAAVAIWFAARKSPTAGARHRRCTSCRSARRAIFSLVLPPPFVERLHRQRGIFIRCAPDQPLEMDKIIELRFPANMDGKLYDFRVIRHGKHVDILKDHTWIRKVVNWSKDVAADSALESPNSHKSPTQLNSNFALFLKGVKHAKTLDELLDQKKTMRHLARWGDYFNDQMYWLAYRFDDFTPGREERLHRENLAPLVRENSDLARIYVSLSRVQWKKKNSHFKDQVLMIGKVILEEIDAT